MSPDDRVMRLLLWAAGLALFSAVAYRRGYELGNRAGYWECAAELGAIARGTE